MVQPKNPEMFFPKIFKHTEYEQKQVELCLKSYSPLAVVLWFTLTQHEETSWARLDGLKERRKAWGDGSKDLWRGKNKSG